MDSPAGVGRNKCDHLHAQLNSPMNKSIDSLITEVNKQLLQICLTKHAIIGLACILGPVVGFLHSPSGFATLHDDSLSYKCA